MPVESAVHSVLVQSSGIRAAPAGAGANFRDAVRQCKAWHPAWTGAIQRRFLRLQRFQIQRVENLAVQGRVLQPIQYASVWGPQLSGGHTWGRIDFEHSARSAAGSVSVETYILETTSASEKQSSSDTVIVSALLFRRRDYEELRLCNPRDDVCCVCSECTGSCV